MTMEPRILVGSDEQVPLFERELDNDGKLSHPGTPYFYDFHVYCANGDQAKVERKTLDDLRGSFDEGKLEHQCHLSDILIVEIGPITWNDVPERARKRLWHLQESMPVVTTKGPTTTVEYLRRLSKRGMEPVRSNRVVSSSYSTRWSLLSTLYRINPEYEEEGGRYRGDVLGEIVDWETVVEGLKVDEWAKLDSLGPVTVEKIRASLIDGVEPR